MSDLTCYLRTKIITRPSSESFNYAYSSIFPITFALQSFYVLSGVPSASFTTVEELVNLIWTASSSEPLSTSTHQVTHLDDERQKSSSVEWGHCRGSKDSLVNDPSIKPECFLPVHNLSIMSPAFDPSIINYEAQFRVITYISGIVVLQNSLV